MGTSESAEEQRPEPAGYLLGALPDPHLVTEQHDQLEHADHGAERGTDRDEDPSILLEGGSQHALEVTRRQAAQTRGQRVLEVEGVVGVVLDVMERVNKEIKRRTRVATLFPSEASCERLVTAIAMEISEEWTTGRTYLNMSEVE